MLTADLPLATPEDIEADPGRRPARAPGRCSCPRCDGTGTNAMLLRPPAALRPASAPTRCARHRAQAGRRGLAVALTEQLPRLALDIDTPRDLAAP